MKYPWWLQAIGYGLGGALVAAIFSDGIFAVGLAVLPLSAGTFARWANNPPVGALCFGVGLVVAVFAAGILLGARSGGDSD